MRSAVWFILFLACQLSCFSKKEKTAMFYVFPGTSAEAHYTWSINGKTVNDSLRCVLPVHYPDFDTITLSCEHQKRLIITSLKKGHIYELDQDGGTIRDITEKMRKKRNKLSTEKDTLKVVFRYKNLPKDTMMAGSFGWIRQNFTHGKVFGENGTVLLEETELVQSAGHSYDIRIGYGSVRREVDTYNDSRFLNFNYDEEQVFVFDEELFAFEYQFFDKKTLYVDYDGKNRNYKLTLKH